VKFTLFRRRDTAPSDNFARRCCVPGVRSTLIGGHRAQHRVIDLAQHAAFEQMRIGHHFGQLLHHPAEDVGDENEGWRAVINSGWELITSPNGG